MAKFDIPKAGLQVVAVFAIALVGCETPRNGADLNGDGSLSVAEFEAVLLNRIMAYSDADGDGALSYAEWSTNYAAADKAKFQAADLNGDGKLDRVEAEATTKTSPLWQKLMVKIDLDGDGEISESERSAFLDVMAKADDDDQVNMLRRIAEE